MKIDKKNSCQKIILKLSIALLFFIILSYPFFSFAQTITVPNTGPTNLEGVISNILNVVFTLAAVVAVIYIIWGGYQYITSGGGDGAEAGKKTLINAIIGLILIIASVAIVNFVNDTAGGTLHINGNNTNTNSTQTPTNNTGQKNTNDTPDSPITPDT